MAGRTPPFPSYRTKGDWTWFDCYNRMSKAPPDQLVAIFSDCGVRFKPVFHNFFLEAFRCDVCYVATGCPVCLTGQQHARHMTFTSLNTQTHTRAQGAVPLVRGAHALHALHRGQLYGGLRYRTG